MLQSVQNTAVSLVHNGPTLQTKSEKYYVKSKVFFPILIILVVTSWYENAGQQRCITSGKKFHDEVEIQGVLKAVIHLHNPLMVSFY